MHRLRPHSRGFTLLLGALTTLASFATDMGLPVLAGMADSLGVPAGRAALSLSVFMAGFALGPLVFGPVSDHVGRRRVLLTGVAMFTVFGGFAAFTRSLGGYARVLRHRVSIGYILVVALNFGCLFAYVSGSSLVLIGVLGVSQRMYGLLFAATAFGLMIGALTNARLSKAGISHARLMWWGQALIVGTALALLAFTVAAAITVWLLVPLAVIGFIGQGIVRPNAVQGALEPLPEIAGVASAVLSALQMIVGAASSAIVAEWFDGHSAFAVTAMMAITASLSAIAYATLVRPAERGVPAISVSVR